MTRSPTDEAACYLHTEVCEGPLPNRTHDNRTKTHKEIQLCRSSDSKQETICKFKRAGQLGTLSASRGFRLGAKLWGRETL